MFIISANASNNTLLTLTLVHTWCDECTPRGYMVLSKLHTLIISVNVCYYLELHIAMMSCSRVQFLLMNFNRLFGHYKTQMALLGEILHSH